MKGLAGNKNRTRILVTALLGAVIFILVLTGYFIQRNQENSIPTRSERIVRQESHEEIEDTKLDEAGSAEQQEEVRRSFEVAELGIKFDLVEGLESLEYQMEDSSYTDESGAYVERSSPAFTTKELIGGDSRCGYGSLGIMLELQPAAYASPSDPTVEVEEDKFLLNRPQSPCTDNLELGNLQVDQMSLLIDAFSSAQKIN